MRMPGTLNALQQNLNDSGTLTDYGAKGIENGSAGTGLHNILVMALHGTQEPGLPLVIYHAVWLGFQ